MQCARPGCEADLPMAGGRGSGHPRKWCDAHVKPSVRARRHAPRAMPPPCCAANGGRQCEQHKQWARFRYDNQCTPPPVKGLPDWYGGSGYQVRCSDSFYPDNAEDRAQERAIEKWLKASGRNVEAASPRPLRNPRVHLVRAPAPEAA